MKTVEQILAKIKSIIRSYGTPSSYRTQEIIGHYERLKQFILKEPTEQELMLRDLPSEIEYLKDQIDLRVKLLYKIQNSESKKCEHVWDYSIELTSCRKCGLPLPFKRV